MSQSGPSKDPVTSDPGCEWSYTGSNGPQHWGTLHNRNGICWPLCASISTSQQSPINIYTDKVTSDPNLPEPEFNYSNTSVNVRVHHNNCAVFYPSGSSNTLSYNGTTYDLVGFHFHHPAEHPINGATAKIEVHLVHSAQTGNPPQALVVATFMDQPSTDPEAGKILKDVVDNVGGSFNVNATDLLPATLQYFTYQGSMTTPPCAENVIWLVLYGAMSVFDNYVLKFKSALEDKYNWGYNARDVQSLNGRTVYSSPEFGI